MFRSLLDVERMGGKAGIAGISLRRKWYVKSNRSSLMVVVSYISDWIMIAAAAAVGYLLGEMTPNKRHFNLYDRDISFPFTEHETVPVKTLVLCDVVAPIVIIAIISLIFVPGATVPRGTSKSLIWRRKLWELHAGLQGLALSVCLACFITNGMKNMCGKPRPDLLSRCKPDLASLQQYIVGGYVSSGSNGQLVSADICTNTDRHKLNDGFRSYPSGHSSSAAAGLVYLSLFVASKFAITVPFLSISHAEAQSVSASPSWIQRNARGQHHVAPDHVDSLQSSTMDLDFPKRNSRSTAEHQTPILIASARRRAAAPPIYLLAIAACPTAVAIFIASSRWFDFRHHGFDILFGFSIGVVTAIFAFRYYHLPMSRGAGWAWGPRCRQRAFWAGVGTLGYAQPWDANSHRDAELCGEKAHVYGARKADVEKALTGNINSHASSQRERTSGIPLQPLDSVRVGRTPHARAGVAEEQSGMT